MGMSTLNGIRVTTARVTIPKWGCGHAEVSLDGEHALAGRVTLKVADATYECAVLSGGAMLGRSSYRLVFGAGGWGQPVPAASYPDDAGVKFSTVLGDAAQAVGETMAPIASTLRTGPNWAREAGPASLVLNALAPGGWYVDEAGVTHVGARAVGALPANVTRIAPVDLARGKVVLAAESIVAILPGLVVDGLTAVDVQHDISPEGGLRSTVYGSSAADQMRKLGMALDPNRDFRNPSEYRVDVASGNRLHLQPLRSHMPYLKYVPVRPGVSGCNATVALGSFVVVSFLHADPSRPFVEGFADVDADRFQPSDLEFLAGAMAGGEHVATVEGTVLFVYNTLVALMAAAGGGPLLAAVLQPLLGTALSAALAAQTTPAPPTEVAQIPAAAALQAGFAAGTTPSNAMFAAWTAAIAGLAAKTSNESGSFPSLGCKAVKAG